MKKILIGFIILIIIAFLYLTLVNGLKLGQFKIESISDIKSSNDNLENKEKVTKGKQQEHEQQARVLKGSIESLKSAKAKYESRMQAMGEEETLETAGLKGYQLDFLFANVDSYAGKRGIDMQMDLKTAGGTGIYNLEFIAVGSYVGITDFIYDIENDGNLNFRIEDFQIRPRGASSDPGSASAGDTKNLQATFTVKEVEIKF